VTRLLRKPRVIAALAAALVAVLAVAAWAFWTTSGAGTAVGSVGTLSAPGQPTTSPSGASIDLNWSAASVSGGGTVGYHVERRANSGSTWSDVCGSSDAAPITATSCTDTPTFGSYVYRVTARFNSWHTTGAESDPASPGDPTPPSFGSPALSFATSGGSAFYPGTGTAVYYNGTTGTGSSITVSAPNVSDPDSDIQKVNFASPAGFSGGGDDTSSPFSATYTWSSSSASGPQTVTATNGGGTTAATSFSLVSDVTAPTGGAVTVAGASSDGATVNNTSGSFTVAGLTQYSEAQSASASGLASSSLLREQADFNADGSCDSNWSNPTTISANRTENSTNGIASGNCYRYTLEGIDRVDNSASIQIIVKVDTTSPSFGSPAVSLSAAGAFAFYPGTGTTVYYNGTTGTSSSITASAPNVSDPNSGLQKVNFPSPAGFSGGGDDTSSPYSATYTWSSSSATGTQTLTATNGAGGTATTTFSLVRDVTAPTGGAVSVAATSAAVGGASVNNTTGSYSISGLSQYSETQSATVSGLASSSLVREQADFNANGTCDSNWTNPTTISANRTENSSNGIASGSCYRYTLKGTDNVGNSASVQVTVKVDTTGPSVGALSLSASGGNAFYPGSGSTVYYNGNTGSGSSLTISAPNASDPDSGIQKVNFPSLAGFTGGGDVFASPFSATYTWTSAAVSGAQTVTATNGAGGSGTGTFTLARDIAAPTGGALTVAGASTNGSTVYTNSTSYSISTLTQYSETQSATASGLASSSLVRDRATLNADGSCDTTWTAATTITSTGTESAGISAGRCYRYTLKGTDNVGNSATIQIIVEVDTDPPAASDVALANASGGTLGRVGAGDTVTIDYDEPLDATSVCSSFINDGTTQTKTGNNVVNVSVTNNGTNDSLSVTATNCTMHIGTIALGADYVTANKSYSGTGGNASMVSWNPTTRELKITLGSGTAGEQTNVAASVPTYAADTAIKDLAGNTIPSGPFTGSSSRF
jgi:hypothetical protein